MSKDLYLLKSGHRSRQKVHVHEVHSQRPDQALGVASPASAGPMIAD